MELHQLRTRRRLTLADVARELGWSKAKAGHFETGERLPGYADLEALTALYEATDRLDVLWQRAGVGRRRGWWEDQYSPDQYGPEAFGRFVGLEQGARELLLWHPILVVGLLQTPDYARAVFTALGPAGQSDQLVEDRTALRLRRQSVIESATVRVVLGEGALRLMVGGPDVLRDQLDHLVRLAEHPHVDLRLLPDSAGLHPGLHGPFTVLRFPHDPHIDDPGVVYGEGLLRATWYDEPEEIEAYASTFADLVAQAASPDGTVDLIRRHRKEIQ